MPIQNDNPELFTTQEEPTCAVCGQPWPHESCSVPAVLKEVVNSIYQPKV